MGERTQSGKSATEASTGWEFLSVFLSGMLVWGGIGALLDRWQGVNFFLPAGLLVGVALSMYLVIKRFGQK